MPDYETLRILWWLLLGIVLIGFAVTDGFDLGIAALLRVLAHDDDERRALLETIEPTWEGNQVWFIVGGAAVFAAWPLLYAASFSGFYFAILLVLLALIVRPVGFNFRNKIADTRWRETWDWILTFAGAIPALIFGVAFGNLFLGVPFRYDETLRMTYEGNLLGLLRPFPLLAGIVSLSMVLMHGAAWAAVKFDESLAHRAEKVLRLVAPIFVVSYVACGVWLAFGVTAYSVQNAVTDAASNPLLKDVVTGGSWLSSGVLARWAWVAGAIAVVAGIAVPLLATRRRHHLAFFLSGIALAGTILSAGFALYPFLMPSDLDPRSSLTIWDASSSRTTLGLMLIVTVLLLPIVLAYTAWVYRVLRGRVSLAHVKETHGMY